METLEPILTEHPFFANLDRDIIRFVAGCASNVRFAPDDYLIRSGQEANLFYLIREGRVSLEIFVPGRGAVSIDTYDDGDVLGWSWLIPPYQWQYDARATMPVRAIALDGKCLRTKCEQDHNIGYELLKRFGHIIEERLRGARLQLLDVYGSATIR